ncbi:MAG: Ig-like domain-containing protein [Lachnospiraceae bacterium]|nr:Ig-like domain-containing protein [Lachnospiraceae bacterium]
MKKKLCSLIIVMILLAFLPLQVFAEDTEHTCTHTWSSWETLIEPTCGESGKQERYCFNCYEREYTDIPVTGQHQWDDWYTIKSATISKTGLKERECLVCGETQTNIIPKLKPFIKLSKKTLKIQVAKTYTLKIKYAKGDSIKKCKSSNKKVATVSKSGKIKAHSTGITKITIILKSGKKATCKVTATAKKKTASTNKTASKGTVYWTPNGSVYHGTKNCPTLSRSRTIYSGSISDCPKPRPCKVCY